MKEDLTMAYVIKYNGNIVAGPFLSEYAAVQKRSKLFKEYGSTAISLSDFKIIKE
jgi:hypothetical protein